MTDAKPPIGARPCYIVAEERIEELAKAIANYAHGGHYEEINKWASEIMLQTMMCQQLGGEKRERVS